MTLLEWLTPLADKIISVSVTIGKNTYEGVRYTRTLTHSSRPYQEESIVFLGKRPKFKKNTCFRLVDTETDWYPSWYSPDVIKPEHQQYHPCGHVWSIAPWTPEEPIDRYEKYHRQNMEIVEHESARMVAGL